MTTVYYSKTSITGGGAGSLDFLDGTNLSDGDHAFVFSSTSLYHYKLSASLGGSTNIPYVITPLTNAGTKRWVKQNPLMNPYSPDGVSIDGYTTTQGATQDNSSGVNGAPGISETVMCMLQVVEAGTYLATGWSAAWTNMTAWQAFLYIRAGSSGTYLTNTLVATTFCGSPNACDSTIHNGGHPMLIKWVGTLTAGQYVGMGCSATGTGGSSTLIGMNYSNQTGMRFLKLY